MGRAALKRCHNLDWLIEQIRQNVTSELRSVCWIEGNVKCRWNIVRETWGWNCTSVRVYSWHFEYRFWRSYYKQRGCSVSLLLWLASWGCLKIYRHCNILLETNMVQPRNSYIQSFWTASCHVYPSSYNFDCGKWFLRIAMRTSDCPLLTFCIL
jgi:hypothetical protein